MAEEEDQRIRHHENEAFVEAFYEKLDSEDVQFCREIFLLELLLECDESWYEGHCQWMLKWKKVSKLFESKRTLFWKLIVQHAIYMEKNAFFTHKVHCGRRFLNLMSQFAGGVLNVWAE